MLGDGSLIAGLRRLPLRTFPEALEPDFRAYYQARSVPFVRAAALLAAAIYLVFLFWDLVVDPEVIPFSLRVRASVSLILVGHFACTFHPWFIATAAQDSAAAVAAFALDMVEGVSAYGRRHGYPLTLRVGIHTGEVVSGVIGLKKFSYDLWGETVNLASRLESQSGAGQIQVGDATYQRLYGRYRFTPRGLIKLRGIGEIPAYFLVERNVPLGNRRLTG
jgi:class 3 adenylate cyclase